MIKAKDHSITDNLKTFYLTFNISYLKACSDVAHKMHQPGLFCFTYAKKTQKIEKILSTAFYAGMNET